MTLKKKVQGYCYLIPICAFIQNFNGMNLVRLVLFVLKMLNLMYIFHLMCIVSHFSHRWHHMSLTLFRFLSLMYLWNHRPIHHKFKTQSPFQSYIFNFQSFMTLRKWVKVLYNIVALSLKHIGHQFHKASPISFGDIEFNFNVFQ